MNTKKGRIGSSFDEFLKEAGICEEVTAGAINRVIARQREALTHEKGSHRKRAIAKRVDE